METASENLVATINKNYFLAEFTYSRQRFRTTDKQEHEFADAAIWLDDLLILQQVKERGTATEIDTPDREGKWFKKKVISKGVDQLNDTHEHRRAGTPLLLYNERGVIVDLGQCRAKNIHNVIVYRPSSDLPEILLQQKSRKSSRIGFVHLFNETDYVRTFSTLITPMEIGGYLSWRQSACEKHLAVCSTLSEKALVGQYLSGELDSMPAPEFELYVNRLAGEDEWQLVYNIMYLFRDRIEKQAAENDHYRILKELAKLNRGMMGKFIECYKQSVAACKKPSAGLPRRLSIQDNDCSFIFIPLSAKDADKWERILPSFTCLSKHGFKTTKAVGMTFSPAPDSASEYLVNWCYVEFVWEADSKADELLKYNSPFRPAKTTNLPRYRFTSD